MWDGLGLYEGMKDQTAWQFGASIRLAGISETSIKPCTNHENPLNPEASKSKRSCQTRDILSVQGDFAAWQSQGL